MRTILAESLDGENSFKAFSKNPLTFPFLQKVIDIFHYSGIELKGILLFSDVDRVAIYVKTLPKLERFVVLQLRLEEVSEHSLQLVEHAATTDMFSVLS